MEPYQERVVAEKQELDDKIDKLESFLHSGRSDAVPKNEGDRMHRQLYMMKEYSAILGERIESFGT